MTGIPALQGMPPRVPPRGSAALGRGGFSVSAAAAAPAGPGPASAAAPAAALAGLLALQETEPDVMRDRAARRHGRAMLAALAAWQRALLGGPGSEAGTGPAAALERLGTLLATMPPAADPALAAVLDGVALRCRVELARSG